jgi:cold shock CspA family protein
MNGVVSEFSIERGLGTVTSQDGRSYLFHAIEIADGSRAIDVGRRVVFRTLPRFGELQAGAIRKV